VVGKEKKKKQQKKKEKKGEVSQDPVSLRQFLPNDWFQKVKHLRILFLHGKGILPMKPGTTGGNAVITIEPEGNAYKFTPFKTSTVKLDKNENPFWGTLNEFHDIYQATEAPVKISIFDEDSKAGNLLIGTIKLNLLRMFETSNNEGGSSVEKWYRVMPTPDALTAIKSYGTWWGIKDPVIELNLRFIAHS